jgi:hypothetical protein
MLEYISRIFFHVFKILANIYFFKTWKSQMEPKLHGCCIFISKLKFDICMFKNPHPFNVVNDVCYQLAKSQFIISCTLFFAVKELY